jgi:transcriptional/translational regulatory protein YebC/TACO1
MFTKHGGSMAESGAVMWNFEQKGLIVVPKEACSADDIFEKAVEAGADDVDTNGDDVYEITTSPGDLHVVTQALEEMKIKAKEARLTMYPKTTIKVEGKAAASVLKLMEAIEDHDDVQDVYANFDISEEEMAALMED